LNDQNSVVGQTPANTETMIPAHLPEMPAKEIAAEGTFASFGLAAPIQKALDAAGYTEPTPIQAGAIPVLLQHRDMLGIAQTGTGKTAAFALPILHRLATTPYQLIPKACRTLILAPTRELVIQIADSFRTYGKHVRMKSCAVFGGVSEMHQIKAMSQGVDVLVATPGRLLDLVQRRHISLGSVQTFVLDEADRMLDMGFIRDINRIVPLLPAERQSLLFSATMPKEIAHLAAKLLRDPVRVEVTPEVVTVDRIEQKVYFVDANQKRPLLAELLKDPALSRVVVFTRTKHVANRVTDYISAAGITADAIHGNKSQNARQKALENFKKGHVRVLVATDIAARGIHVSDISHVINYELPNIPESYVHRIGRTARAGAEGIALSFCDKAERSYLRDIERFAKTRLTPTEHAFSGPGTRDAGDSERAERPRGDRGGRGRPQGDRNFRGREQGDRPRGDRPFGDRPRGDRPRGDRPFGDRPRSDRPNGDRPHGDRPHGDRPHRDRVHADRPRHEHTRPAHVESTERVAEEPRNRGEANLSHAERYFGAGRSPTRDGQKRGDGFRPEGGKPHGEHADGYKAQEHKPSGPKGHGPKKFGQKHGGKPFGKPRGGKPFGKPHGNKANDNRSQGGERPMRRQNKVA
jgi:ATP-dependent RNA helicase RhlE